MLANDLAGIYHAGGPRRLSLYQIAQIVNRAGGYDPNHLMGCPRTSAGPIPPRAGNVSLDSSKLARALGYEPFDPWPLDEHLTPTHADWHRDRPADDYGSPAYLAEVLYRNPARVKRASA
jgi:dTDP-4-dehydrorhamnose reductase